MDENYDLELAALKRYLYGYIRPTENEFEIMDMVSDSLEYVNLPTNIENMPMEDAIREGIMSLRVFDRNYVNKVKKIVLMTYDELQENDLRTMIRFKMSSHLKKRGRVSEIKIPETANKLTPIWIGHEYIHALKDTNYNENILKNVSSETLPMFYEMLVANLFFEDHHDEWKQSRLAFLMNNKNAYTILKENIDDVQLESVMHEYGQYLTSYYYAVNLFHLYKQNPKQITKIVNKVLRHKITTLDLLKKLDIYEINKEHVNIYKLEHNNL